MRKQTNVSKLETIKKLSKIDIRKIKGGAAIENGPDFLTT